MTCEFPSQIRYLERKAYGASQGVLRLERKLSTAGATSLKIDIRTLANAFDSDSAEGEPSLRLKNGSARGESGE